MGKAHGRGQLHGLFDILRAVLPADGGEHPGLQRLGIYADPVRTVIQQHLQLLPVDGVRPSRLDAVFHAVGQVEIPVHRRQQRIHLTGGQGGGRAAAHVERLDPQARLLHHAACGLHLRRQRRQIRLHQLEGLFHRRRYEAAIGAAGGAEGDADVQRDVLGAQVAPGLQARLGALQRQTPPRRGDAVRIPQHPVRLGGGHAVLQHGPHQLGRTDARQRAPAGRHAGDVPGRPEKGQLQRTLTQAFPFVCVGNACGPNAGLAPRRFAAIGQCRDPGGIYIALMQCDLRVAVPVLALIYRALLREKGQQALLDGVAVLVTAQVQLHCAVPCRI